MKRMHNPPHPGQVLREYLGNMSLIEAALKLGLEQKTLQRLIDGQSDVSPEIAARLAAGLGTHAQFWSGLQQQYNQPATDPAAYPHNQHKAG